MAAAPCTGLTIDPDWLSRLEVGRDPRRQAVALSGGTLVGAITVALLSKQLAAAVTAQIMDKKGIQAAVALAAKGAAKRGGGVLAAAAGAPALCAPTGAGSGSRPVAGGDRPAPALRSAHLRWGHQRGSMLPARGRPVGVT